MEIMDLLAPSAELNGLYRLLHQRSNSSSALFSWRMRRSYTGNGHVNVMLLCKEWLDTLPLLYTLDKGKSTMSLFANAICGRITVLVYYIVYQLHLIFYFSFCK